MMRAAGDLEPAALGGTYSCRIMVWRLTNASALAAVFRVASSCTHPIRHQFRRLFDDVNDERKEDGTSFWLESNTHSPSSSCRNMRHDSSRISAGLGASSPLTVGREAVEDLVCLDARDVRANRIAHAHDAGGTDAIPTSAHDIA
eukprot:2301156-Rhodomonas_salina.1